MQNPARRLKAGLAIVAGTGPIPVIVMAGAFLAGEEFTVQYEPRDQRPRPRDWHFKNDGGR